MAKVYIVNKSAHDFTKAEQFGNLIYCTQGRMDRFGTNNMIRKLKDSMRNSGKDDYILLCSLSVLNALACAVFASKHGVLNLLIFKPSTGEYIERNHVLS